MALLPEGAALEALVDVEDARRWAQLAAEPWSVVAGLLGNPGSLRVLAAVSPVTVREAVEAARVMVVRFKKEPAAMRTLLQVEATKVSLMWRAARKVFDLSDCDPLDGSSFQSPRSFLKPVSRSPTSQRRRVSRQRVPLQPRQRLVVSHVKAQQLGGGSSTSSAARSPPAAGVESPSEGTGGRLIRLPPVSVDGSSAEPSPAAVVPETSVPTYCMKPSHLTWSLSDARKLYGVDVRALIPPVAPTRQQQPASARSHVPMAVLRAKESGTETAWRLRSEMVCPVYPHPSLLCQLPCRKGQWAFERMSPSPQEAAAPAACAAAGASPTSVAAAAACGSPVTGAPDTSETLLSSPTVPPEEFTSDAAAPAATMPNLSDETHDNNDGSDNDGESDTFPLDADESPSPWPELDLQTSPIMTSGVDTASALGDEPNSPGGQLTRNVQDKSSPDEPGSPRGKDALERQTLTKRDTKQEQPVRGRGRAVTYTGTSTYDALPKGLPKRQKKAGSQQFVVRKPRSGTVPGSSLVRIPSGTGFGQLSPVHGSQSNRAAASRPNAGTLSPHRTSPRLSPNQSPSQSRSRSRRQSPRGSSSSSTSDSGTSSVAEVPDGDIPWTQTKQAGRRQAVAMNVHKRNVIIGEHAYPTASPGDVAMVFRALSEEGSIHYDFMSKALTQLGFGTPDVQWLNHAWRTITHYTTVDLQQFDAFVLSYSVQQYEAWTEEFGRWDADGSGTIDTNELSVVLKHFGIEPLKQVVASIVRDLHSIKPGVITVQEFHEIMNSIQTYQGFSKKDYEGIADVFVKFSRDGAPDSHRREINVMRAVQAIAYMGYAASPEKMNDIFDSDGDIEEDSTKMLSEREFLLGLRKVRDREIDVVKASLYKMNMEHSTIQANQVSAVLEDLSYYASKSALPDALEEAQLSKVRAQETTMLGLSEVWQVIETYRAREGFSRAEMRVIQEAEAKFADPSSEGMGILSIDGALRWLGYQFPFDMLARFISEVDWKQSGHIDPEDFKKLVRNCRNHHVEDLLDAFRRYDMTSKGVLDIASAQRAYTSIKCVDINGHVPKLPKSAGSLVELGFFVQAGVSTKLDASYYFFSRENEGFSTLEARNLRRAFAECDFTGELRTDKERLMRYLEHTYPETLNSPEGRHSIEKAVLLVTERSAPDTCIEFQSFLHRMRKIMNFQIQKKLDKEKLAVEETCFSYNEVCEFRKLFLDNSNSRDGGGVITQVDIKQLLAVVLPMGDSNAHRINALFQKCQARAEGVDSSKSGLDFPQFLWMMKELLDLNIMDIRRKTIATIGQPRKTKANDGASHEHYVAEEH